MSAGSPGATGDEHAKKRECVLGIDRGEIKRVVAVADRRGKRRARARMVSSGKVAK
ncbi:MAG: hypothetical protein ABI323_10650 [Solirubrobacteraceae bacterium]